MQKSESQTQNSKLHSVVNIIAITALASVLTTALIIMQLHMIHDITSAENESSAIYNPSFSSEDGRKAITDKNTERVLSTVSDDSPDNSKVYFIRLLDTNGSENFSFSEHVDKSGVVTYGYQLNKTIDELLADGSILFTDKNIVSAKSVGIPTCNEKEEFSVVLELSDTDATSAINTAIALQCNDESVGIYHNQSFFAVEPVTEFFGDGALLIPGFADEDSANDFIKNLHAT